MIFPQQTILPLVFPDESQDTIQEHQPDLGPLNLHICNGIEFTTKHQLPIVKPENIDIPKEMKAFYRLKSSAKQNIQDVFAHFYSPDYNGKESYSHAHEWYQAPDGNMHRKDLKGNNHLQIPSRYTELIKKIEMFNKEKHKSTK